MSNLIPERRADKRGNIVTRWVRSFNNKDSAKNIPAPVAPVRSIVAMTESREKQYKDLSEYLRECMSFGTRSNIEPSVETIARYDPELLDRITEVVEDGSEFEGEFWSEMFGNRHIVSDASPKRLEEMLEKCHAAFAVNSLVKRIAGSGGNLDGDYLSAMQIGDVVNSITRGKVHDNFDATIGAVTMVVYIKQLHLDASWSATDNAYVSYSEILEEAKYIASRAEEVEAILPELLKRNAFDRKTIDALLDAPVRVLMEGAL
jgi:hypothetical protein